MSKIFTFADDSTDFEEVKSKGVRAVLIKYSSKISKNIKTASSLGMKIMVELPYGTKEDVHIIRPLAGRVTVEDGEIEYVSVKDIENAVKNLGNAMGNVTGVIIPLPRISGLLWNNEIEKQCKTKKEDLYDLFDDEKEISHIRSQYYVSAQKYLYENYMLPQKEFLKSFGKKTVFCLGKKELQYDLLGNLVNTITLKRMGFCLGAFGEEEIAIPEFGLRGGDFVFWEDACRQISEKRITKDMLLVKPARGVVERYVETGIRNRLETPALASAIESVYFCEILGERGYAFDVADEYSFLQKRNIGKYKDILICKSCLFTDKEMSKIDRLLEKGVRINSSELLSKLLKQGEEEWEK